MKRRAILAVPCCEDGRGGGHLVRCMALVRELRSLNREAWLFLSNNDVKTNGIISQADFDPSWIIPEDSWNEFYSGFTDAGKTWECIVLDNFQTSQKEFIRWNKLGPLIGIDEGGPCRNQFDFLIDILPNLLQKKIPPNIADPSLLPLPEKKEQKPFQFDNGFNTSLQLPQPLKVLVSFGQEDAAGLGQATANAIAAKNKNSDFEITLLFGGGSTVAVGEGSSFQVLHNIPKLSEHLGEYDLLVTHYGITAFEGLYAGIPVLLLSPGPYHEKLAKAAGFFSAGIGTKSAGRLADLLFHNGKMNSVFLTEQKKICTTLTNRYGLNETPKQSLAVLLNDFELFVNSSCPVCGTVLNDTHSARYPHRSYRRCPVCGVINMSRNNPPPIEYQKEYFFDSYKKQYGKTYIEDFPNLTNMAKRRLDIILGIRGDGKAVQGLGTRDQSLGGKREELGIRNEEQKEPHHSSLPDPKSPALLDIGCAYGPFLAVAKEAGFSPLGIDPAEDAVNYVTQTLNIPAIQGFFPMTEPPPHSTLEPPNSSLLIPHSSFLIPCSFDVITLWYVIEHFRDCAAALAEIRKILKPGGVLAFSTPSYTGISGRSSLYRFLEQSPDDHWTVWSSRSCKKALERAGFTVKKIVSTGHHPERFSVLGKYASGKKSLLYGILLLISRIFSLGDTFEVYAVKLD